MIGVKGILQIQVYLSALVGVLPLLPFIDMWVLVLIGIGFLFGIIGDRSGHYLLGNRLATLFSVGFFLLFVSQASFANLVIPLIHLLCLLLAVRLASDKSARHILQLFLLSTIVLAASSMLTLDLAYLFYLILIILLVTSGLVLLSFYVTDPQIRFGKRQWTLLLKTMALLPAGSLLLMMILFVVLPRTQTPLWNFLNPKTSAAVGMSDQVQPGSVANLAGSAQVAFRAETERLPVDTLYWRGIVLNRLEGHVWKRSDDIADEKLIEVPGSVVEITIYSEPKAEHYLVTLDRPVGIDRIRNRRSSDGVVSRYFGGNQKIRYQVRAQYSASSKQLGDVAEYLRLPNNLSERVRAVGETLKQHGTNQDKRERLNEFFLHQQLNYSTTQLPKTDNPIDTFLFESRRGYCEYFASSYAVLLRLAGIPARLVGGYLGGEFNQLGGYYLIGEDAAHVWVEALDDEGIWQRIDPSRLAVNTNEALLQTQRQGLATLQAFADAVLHNWSRLVLNYDLRQQFSLLRGVVGQVRDFRNVEGRSFLRLLWALPCILPYMAWYYWRRRKTRSERVVRNYRMLIAKAAGVESLPNDLGFYGLAKLCNEPLCYEFAKIYGGFIYRGWDLNDGAYRRLCQIVRQLKNKLPAIQVALPTAVDDNVDSK